MGLPFLLSAQREDLDHDEVVDFTQNGGWQKINTFFPLLFSEGGSPFEHWMNPLRSSTERLKVSSLLLPLVETVSDIGPVPF
jgi:hypothetical protein